MSQTPWINFVPKLNGFLCSRCNESYAVKENDNFDGVARAFIAKHGSCSPFGKGFALVESSEPLPEPVLLAELVEPIDRGIILNIPNVMHKDEVIEISPEGGVAEYLYVMETDFSCIKARKATKQEIFWYVKTPAFINSIIRFVKKLFKGKSNVDKSAM